MSRLFKPTYAKAIPPNAELLTKHGVKCARWQDRYGRRRSGKVTLDGEKVLIESETYFARFRDASGVVKTVSTHCRDLDAARAVLSALEARQEKIRAGILGQAEVQAADHLAEPIKAHLEAFFEYMKGKKGKGLRIRASVVHCQNTRARLLRVVRECDFKTLRSLNREILTRWIKGRMEAGDNAPATINHHLTALISFANWAQSTGRLLLNPLTGFSKLDTSGDKRRNRRALAAVELERLLIAARLRPLAEYGRETQAVFGAKDGRRKRLAPLRFGDLNTAAARGRESLKDNPDFIKTLERRGFERSLIYKTLTLTGLRLGELRSLTIGALFLNGDRLCVRLRPENEKAGRGAEIPIRPDLAAELNAWLPIRLEAIQDAAEKSGKPFPAVLSPETSLFDVSSTLLKSFDRDLAAADIPKRDDRGRTADIHAIRHTFASLLSATGAAPRTAQALMRHSDLKLTMNVYTDPRLLDQAGALAALPELPLTASAERNAARATGTDGRTAQGAAQDYPGRDFSPPSYPEPAAAISRPGDAQDADNRQPTTEKVFQDAAATGEKVSSDGDPNAAENASRNLVHFLVLDPGFSRPEVSFPGNSPEKEERKGYPEEIKKPLQNQGFSRGLSRDRDGARTRNLWIDSPATQDLNPLQNKDLEKTPDSACSLSCPQNQDSERETPPATPAPDAQGTVQEGPSTPGLAPVRPTDPLTPGARQAPPHQTDDLKRALLTLDGLPLSPSEKAEIVRRILAAEPKP